MSVQSDPLPPPPTSAEPVKKDLPHTFIHPWSDWFLRLRDKVNVLNASLLGLSQITGTGILTRLTNSWVVRAIEGASGRINVTNGDGVSGNPTIDFSDEAIQDMITNFLDAGSNITLTYDDALNKLTIASTGGGGGGGGAGAMEFVDSDIAASAQQTLSITAAITGQDIWVLEFCLKNNVGSTVITSLNYNGDFTGTNYYSQFGAAIDTAQINDRTNTADICAMSPTTGCAVGTMRIKLNVDGYPTCLWQVQRDKGSGMFAFHGTHNWESNAAITTIALRADTASGFAVGSWMRLYKLTDTPGSAGGGATIDPIAHSIYHKIVAWWERDETSGAMVDAHVNGINGTYSTVTYNQAPLATDLGASIAFTANTSYAEVTHDVRLCPAYNFAVMVWASRDNVTQPNFAKIMWKPNNTKASGNASYLLQQDNFSNGGKVMFRVTGSGNVDALTTAAWAHSTPTLFVGNKVNTEVQIWRNGAKEGTSANSVILTVPNTSDALRWGAHGSSDGSIGKQDQSAVFKDYLTAEEIAYLYNGGLGISYDDLKTAAGY